MRFSIDDLRQVRRAVADWAAMAGLPGQRAGDFVIAVHEVAANAVRHGSPLARLDLHVTGAVAQAEIRDSGHWPPEPPEATAPRGLGMGLWLAHQVCDEVTIRRSPNGSTVILQVSLPGQDPAQPRQFPGDSSVHLPLAGTSPEATDGQRPPSI